MHGPIEPGDTKFFDITSQYTIVRIQYMIGDIQYTTNRIAIRMIKYECSDTNMTYRSSNVNNQMRYMIIRIQYTTVRIINMNVRM